ncbi:MAG: 4-(cytidine 5'-diphospho)-2-C-methyl-D-erythritol kinase [Thermoleophilia bacterium]
MPELLTPAKINLFLLVGAARPDGYHPVCSLMEKVSLYDRVAVHRTQTGVTRLTGEGLPPGENTIMRAARLLAAEAGHELGFEVRLTKVIPMAAGLAGGSSDAAAALTLLAGEFGIDIDAPRLAALALAVGADVPFFLQPGACLARGVGELLRPVEIPVDYALVIANPDLELATATVYARFDELGEAEPGDAFAARCHRQSALLPGLDSLDSLVELLHNDLEPAAISLCPPIADLKRELLAQGAAGALMSGSGPSVFGLFAGKNQARQAAAALARQYSRVWAVAPVRG